MRDEYNNPVSGVGVTRNDTGENETTDERGRVRFQARRPKRGTEMVTSPLAAKVGKRCGSIYTEMITSSSSTDSYYNVSWNLPEFPGNSDSDCNYDGCVDVSERTNVTLPVSRDSG